MIEYYLAIDIGASSGRHILGYIEDGKIKLEEVHRFSNEIIKLNGHLCWDLKTLFDEIKNGLKKCKLVGKIPCYMGIDTWGVDFVLLDHEDHTIGDAVSYRDNRTIGIDKEVDKIIPIEELYERTGIQKMSFNTIYQLMAIKNSAPEQLEAAESLLMLPDYFNFLLTGLKKSEYTNATTTELVNINTRNWDYELIKKLDLPEKLFIDLSSSGTKVGEFTREIQDELGYSSTVLLPPTHDTASAILATPMEITKPSVYISSGTWSLFGTELKEANCSIESREANFTNEGGFGHRYLYLKNIMGLWMIQCVKRELNDKYSYAELCEMASKETIDSIINCNDDSFLSPDSMMDEIKAYCKRTDQAVPNTHGEIAAVIYNSLAKCYAETMDEIENLTGQNFEAIHIVGGGSMASYLNELTAKYTKKTVFAGPEEATAIGNIISQMLYNKVFDDIEDARECVRKSFEIRKV